MIPPKMLTTKEAAAVLNTTDWQVRYYINKGLLKASKLGKGSIGEQWRIWEHDLMEFANRNTNVKR